MAAVYLHPALIGSTPYLAPITPPTPAGTTQPPPVTPPVIVGGGGGGGGPVREVRAYASMFDRAERRPKAKPAPKPKTPEKPKKKRWQDYLPEN